MSKAELFEQQRSLLFAIAYRMLGSICDAEDMVQESFLRWQHVSSAVRSPKAYLTTMITRLCVDCLRSRKQQREHYVGIWLPEPLLTAETETPLELAALADSLSIAFLVMLEQLSPIERATFLLREVFDYEYRDIAAIVNKSEANCRQIVSRARRSLSHRSIDLCDYNLQQAQVEKFLSAWNAGDVAELIALMTEDVTYMSDGGGKVPATLKPLQGAQKIAQFLVAIRRSKLVPTFTPQTVQINGQPGIINFVDGSPQSTVSFEFVDGYIQSIFSVVNPAKLKW